MQAASFPLRDTEIGRTMGSTNRATTGRVLVMVAVFMMAAGKVAYGTLLTAVPSQVYVLFCFGVMPLLFWPRYGRRVGTVAWRHVLMLNLSTALCFLFFFYALKLIEPAVAGAVQFGVGPGLSILILFLVSGIIPGRARVIVCLGLLAGCSILAVSAVQGSGFAVGTSGGWTGLVAILLSAMGSVLITFASKALSDRGWPSGAILAHRCYLIVPIAVVLTVLDDKTWLVDWTPRLMLILAAVGLLGTVIPMVFLQMGIERSDPHTVLVMMAAMPIFTFALEGFSPLYVWSPLTAAGLCVIALFIAFDAISARRHTAVRLTSAKEV
ncbi:DMT family transporter [Mesorhizobium sp. J428]|uniref:DMT family transporter n=1 Tax=Mesorhizobium sp. J428 TaxID=2898440 RepID=UPI002150BD35|nr:DMT family transporter [Mesorhizobium sp. J428]MCR5858025.1 DMT family transporter [Mesorhizobium sp. J428]